MSVIFFSIFYHRGPTSFSWTAVSLSNSLPDDEFSICLVLPLLRSADRRTGIDLKPGLSCVNLHHLHRLKSKILPEA
ncbi:hypothetical protein Pyn_06890 [Prunus yedoensis var. nudiflora]|uniref:Uncharacterized protein n=1 Tax=Prunus yedoensis var. nudiflora TaxID=2094558 RepID=A0A314ZAE0_PRUYE|nr:hypothetical protein Pyn_06890 [Prunus yedoensis var. nudiflora]